jgi:hypothetical protein
VLTAQATQDAQDGPLDRATVGIGVVLFFIGLTGMAILRGLASLAEGAERQRRMLADQATRSSPPAH